MRDVFCIPCTRGSFNSAQGGVTACEKCDAGTYMSFTGAIRGCTLCPAGKYATATGAMVACSLEMNCPMGIYSSMAGATAPECGSCAAGKFSDATTCVRCGPGSISAAAGTTNCSRCPSGSYSAHYGASACVDCPWFTSASLQIASDSAAHCRCRPGYVCKYTPQLVTLVVSFGLNVSALADAAGVPPSAVVLR